MSPCPLRFYLAFLALLFSTSLYGQDVPSLEQANDAYAKHNYREAAEMYGQLLAQDPLPDGVTRDELTFRQADATWRNLAATSQNNMNVFNGPRETLEELAKKLQKDAKGERSPQLWAEVEESLGDSWWQIPYSQNWNEAWPYYQQALDWWAGSTELETARERYLAIVFRCERPPNVNHYWRYGQYIGNWLPDDVLHNAVAIAESPWDKAHAYYLLGLNAMRYNGNGDTMVKAGKYFQEALKAGPKTEWADDALFQYAEWAERYGASYWDENGAFRAEGDLALALQLYQQFVETYPEGDSRYWQIAKNRIEQITRKDLNVHIPYSYAPGSAVSFTISWRNVAGVSVEVYAIDLAKDFQPAADFRASPFDFTFDLKGKTPLTRLSYESDDRAHARQSQNVTLDNKLPTGAYVVQATSGDQTAQGLLLVTAQDVMTLRDPETILAWTTDAVTGKPVEGADLNVWIAYTERQGREDITHWVQAKATSDEGGLVRVTAKDFDGLKKPFNEYQQWVVIAQHESQVATVSQNYYYYHSGNDGSWRVYAFTDRPAYRPGDTIHWKASARIREGSNNWRVPPQQALHYKVYNQQGESVAEGAIDINEYGSIWGEIQADANWKLGMYRVEFRQKSDTGDYIGGDQFFRLEEYKLPEFKVSVQTASNDGEAATAYRLGDDVEVEIKADYYFGGAVTNAEVNVVVTESPYYHYWRPPGRYPWLDAMRAPPNHFYGGGNQVINEVLKTDAEGRARLTLPTNGSSNQDLQYRIEARVIDESRREVSGTATIKVTRNPYFVYLEPERTLYRPGETATININTLNANDDPVEVEGRIRLTREEWMEVWRGPDGEEISGQEFDRRKRKGAGLFSSALNPIEWTRIRQGYDVEEIKVVNLRTNAEGKATFEFTAPKTGYYRVYWVSKPERMAPITRDTAVWVGDSASQSIGYHGELKIVADEESFREGRTAPVMVTTPDPGRWVLMSVQGGSLIDVKVVYLEGNVKLVEYNVDEQWIPNVWLQANANYGLKMHQDQMEINVPPVKHFLDVTVTPNAEDYQPRDNATVMITTRDVNGRPVPAEVALSVFDEAILAIQPTLAPDPREFFYSEKRSNAVMTSLSQQQRQLREIAEQQADASKPQSGNRLGMNAAEVEGMAWADAAPTALAASQSVDYFSAPTAGRAMMSKAAAPGGAGGGEAPAVVVRTDFRSTVFWKPAIITDANGQASVDLQWPDNTTTWNLEARAVGLPSKFGQGDAQAKTRLPLIARLQMPRFLITGDQVTLTGVINNNTDEAMSVTAELAIAGGIAMTSSASQSIDVPAQGSAQVNWSCAVNTPGDAKVTLTARSPEHADAMELTIPVFEHGIDKFLAWSGKMNDASLQLALDIPKFKAEGASFELLLSPSIATTMLDALPYLAQYPYGCTEQTMSRFLPAVIVAKTLEDFGLNADQILEQNFGGIDANTPEKIVQPVKPKKEGDLTNLDDMVAEGLKRLIDFQHSEGGWGWWKEGSSDPYMSAYVVWGLTLAQQAGRKIDGGVLQKGRNYLGLRLVDFETQYDMQAWLLHALACNNRGNAEPKPDKNEARAFANLWKNRDQLNAYTRAMTALSAHWLGFTDEAKILAENLANGVKLDENPQGSTLLPANAPANSAPQSSTLKTAHWGDDGIYWRWSNGSVETTAFVLMALTEITPDSELIEPTMNWLVKNRRGAQWSNTRDTAIVVLALNGWLKQSGELQASGEYTAMLNGEPIGDISVDPENILTAPRSINVPVAQLKEGSNTLTLQRKAGDSPLYFSTRFSFFSMEDPIAPAGNELFVKRDYQRTYPVKTLLDGYDSRTAPLLNDGTAESGDRIEAIVTIEAKNNLEYLLIEDLKPAGFEAVALQSGAALYARELQPDMLDHATDRYTGRQQWVYQELRDRQIACFIDRLPQGLWEIRYELRAEAPGHFSALPVKVEAMYVPEIRGNSAEIKVNVRDR